ncbi:hypothetical protein QBC35DRAFT_507305 [Podospora australis]|uniref:Uncharacterized protein n=1 Tax=Podospora australis TaxID=1536484 RepID=A0AAN7AFB9_9PEZI|nr:hypothetical protein QBC35DRAFT_507305 [Podospora australis]
MSELEPSSISKTTLLPPETPLLETFTRLSPQVFVQESPSPPPANSTDPTTIIIYGWGDALPKHLTKYVAGYRTLFPSARIILIFSPILKALYQTLDARAATMVPVIEAIYGCPITSPNFASRVDEISKKEKILLQVMSNTGGMNCAATFYAFSRATSGKIFPHTLMICDSTPGSTAFLPNIAPWSRAMALGAVSPKSLPAKIPGLFTTVQCLAALFLGSLHGLGWILGATSAAEYSTAVVNDPTLSDANAKKLYLYSKEDDIIYYQDIERHAADARTKGWDVTLEKFEGTPHVGHMKAHPQQYWDAISKAWAEGAMNYKA